MQKKQGREKVTGVGIGGQGFKRSSIKEVASKLE